VENATAGTKACSVGGAGVCDGRGACVECLTETDCPATGNECTYPTCVARACGTGNYADGWVVSTQVAGDCYQNECDGLGNVVTKTCASDRPPDTTCTTGTCQPEGSVDPVLTPTQMPVSLDTPCSENGGSWCGWFGTCVQCNDLVTPETQCPHTDCLKASCSYPEGTCGTTPLDPTQTCSTVSGGNGTCDGAGNCL
jgi:hypothetical protein